MMRIRAAVTLAVLAAGVVVQLASPASAAPSAVVSGGSATNSVARKSAVAVCPAGSRVFGGGGDVTGGGHQVALTGLRPASVLVSGRYLDTFTATAEEDERGYGANWAVYAYAICGPALPGLSIQRSTLTSSAGGDRLQGYVQCPAGTAPLGVGGEVGNGAGNVGLTAVTGSYTVGPYGVPAGRAWSSAFTDETGYSGTWTLTTYGVCAAPPPSLTYVVTDSAYNSLDKTASAECPAGTKVYGAGGSLSYYAGQVHFDRLVPHGAAWTGADVEAREDQTGFAPDWWATSEAICAA